MGTKTEVLEVQNVTCERLAEGVALNGILQCQSSELDGVQLWFRYPLEVDQYLSESAHPWIAALLMPAMRLGRSLRINLPVSSQFYRNMQRFMEIVHVWWPEYRPVAIETGEIADTAGNGTAVGCFFSGGVDSFYTVLKNAEREASSNSIISHLLFIHGFDIGLQANRIYRLAYDNISSAAARFGINLLQCTTNIREVLCEEYASWPYCHGLLMASTALGIEKFWRQVYIPSSHKYSDLFPWGSHPLTDPLISTDAVPFIHDGCEASRTNKVLWQVAKSDIALDYLRVCWRNRFGKYNCGECEKCIRTMINLEVAGVLSKCKTFDRQLLHSDVANIPVRDQNEWSFMIENLNAAVDKRCNPRLIKAIRKSLRPWAPLRPKRLARSIFRRLLRSVDAVLLKGHMRRAYGRYKNPEKRSL